MPVQLKKHHIFRLIAGILIIMMSIPVYAYAENGSDINGDMNGDGSVTAADAAVLLRVLSSANGTDTDLTDEADVTCNMSADNTDALVILMCAADYADTLSTITSSLKSPLLGEKYLDLFTYKGPIQKEGSYKSDSVSVTQTMIRYKDTNCFVADIYIRDISALRTAFSCNKLNGKTQTVLKMAQNNDAIIAVNGDYYTCNNKNALLIRNGKMYHAGVSKRFDTCALYTDGHMQVFPPNCKNSEVEANGTVWQTWTFGPGLIDENSIAKTTFTCNKNICGINPRSAIGYYEPGHYCFVLADGRAGKVSRGLTMEDLAKFMAEELHCVLAYNFDGGQTAVMASRDGVIDDPFNGGRSTSDIVYICDPKQAGGAQ